jgi:hypothetical protein
LAAVSAPQVVGRDQAGSAGRGHLSEPADVADHSRLAERQRGGEHPREVEALGAGVGQGDDVGPAEERGQLGVGHESRDEPDTRTGHCPQRLERHPRPSNHPQLSARNTPPGLEQRLDSLVRAQEPEEQHDRRAYPLQLPRQGDLMRLDGEVLERAVVDDPDLSRVDPEVLHQLIAAVRRVHDDRVDRVIQAPLGPRLTRTGFSRQQVVSGEDNRHARKQKLIDGLYSEPLEVGHVGGPGDRAVAHHVGHVLEQLAGPTRRRARGTHGVPVEQLAYRVAVRLGDRAVAEPAGHQFDLDPGAR